MSEPGPKVTPQPSPTPPGSTAPALEFQALDKVFQLGLQRRPVHAVRGVSLAVEPGEIFGYLGPNGAGKTTSMKMAMGLIQPTAGAVRLFGAPATSPKIRARVGYLPEHPYFYDYLTATEILDFFGELYGLPRAARRARASELLELVGLGDAKGRRLRQFSKGMLQRVGIAQALINDAELVMLDEPLSGLDPIGRKEVRDIIVSLRERGKTVFFSSHILHDIETICDRVAIIREGSVERVGRLDDLLRGTGRAVIEASGASPAALEALGELGAVKALGAGVRVELDEARTDQALRVLLDGGARVTHVGPERESLEELFMREAGRG